MWIKPTSALERLLSAAWKLFLICLLLWIAMNLLARVWIWLVIVVAIGALVWAVVRVRRLRREYW